MHERLASENDWIQNQSKKITKLQKKLYVWIFKKMNKSDWRKGE